MCGIIGYIGQEQVVPLLLEGLKRLEYRGYDSAGIAAIANGRLVRRRRSGKVDDLAADLEASQVLSTVGIGHTRWATHGPPTEINAHPHLDSSGTIAVIHNGIIENYLEIQQTLDGKGHTFVSDTDTEILAHLIEEEAKQGGDFLDAVRRAVSQSAGAYAVAVLHAQTPDRIYVARRGSPLVIGRGDGGTFACSDVPALLGRASQVQFLGEDQVAEITSDAVRIEDFAGSPVDLPLHKVSVDPVSIQKGGYKHFMLKEIHEQARAVGESLREKTDHGRFEIDLDALGNLPAGFENIYIIACGTAYHASLTAEYMWEQLVPVPTQAAIASEFRVRDPHITEKTLVIAVSQSGETVDTLMAVRRARERGAKVIAVVNNERSAIDREADASVYTRAGIEIGVAATKTFTAQLGVLGLLGYELSRRLLKADPSSLDAELSRLALLPGRITETLREEARISQLAEEIHGETDALFLARGHLFPIALEGALKLKEISYIHAEAYPAGEMKHGPIALIDEGTPAVFLLSRSVAFDKVIANMEEVKARKGFVVAVTDCPHEPALHRVADAVIPVPDAPGISRPILFTLPLQLLACHIAVPRGTDVDQPRHLATPVTVE